MACVFHLLADLYPQVLGSVEEFHTLIRNFWKYNNWVVGHIVETHRTGTFACFKCSFLSVSSFLKQCIEGKKHLTFSGHCILGEPCRDQLTFG